MTHAYKFTSAGYTFEKFTEDLKIEVGETLYAICHPVKIDKDIFYINIPEENATRISETLRYSGIWVTAYPMAMTKRFLQNVNK